MIFKFNLFYMSRYTISPRIFRLCLFLLSCTGSTKLKGRLSTVNLFIKVACFVKKRKKFSKAVDQILLVQDGQLY